MAKPTAEGLIELARTELLWKHHFFLIVAMNMKWIECNESWNKTMAVDGKHIWWNREFVESLTVAEVLFVILHELYHVVLGHAHRRGNRNRDKWNAAGDFAINQELVELKVGKMPAKGLIDKALYWGLNAEEIYNRLPDGNYGGSMGVVIDAGSSESELLDAAVAIDILVRQAADAAKRKPGKLPAGLVHLIEELDDPKVDWREKFHRFMSNGSKMDFTLTRPNRNLLALGLYMPSIIKEGINHVVFCRDTSGSLFDGEPQKAIASEIAGAFYGGIVDKVTVIDCDAKVQRVAVYEQGDTLAVDCKGGGGTSFAPSMEYIAKHCHDAQAVVYFTDMYCNEFGPKPECPVLWCIVGPKSEFKRLAEIPPFGECLHIDE